MLSDKEYPTFSRQFLTAWGLMDLSARELLNVSADWGFPPQSEEFVQLVKNPTH